MFKRFFATIVWSAAALTLLPSVVVAQTPPPSPVPSASPAVTPSASPAETPSAGPVVTPTASPGVTPSPSASPSPSPSASPSPGPIPTPLPTPISLPASAPPQIVAVTLSDPVFHSGETVTGTVITSTNVAAVELRLAGRSVRMPRTDFGVWQLSYTVPRIPFWLRKRYTVQVVAMNTAGETAEKDVSVSLR